MADPPEPTWPLAAEHPADLYAGTGEDYDRYRPPYPPALIADLVARAGPFGDGTLVDLACGTGQVARALAPHFATVVAVDQEPDMVAVGRRRARSAGLDHIDWRVGRAEGVALPAGTVDLVTVGSAFHRLDRSLVARRAREWLAPGRCLAVLSATEPTAGDAPWQAAVRRLSPGTPAPPAATPTPPAAAPAARAAAWGPTAANPVPPAPPATPGGPTAAPPPPARAAPWDPTAASPIPPSAPPAAAPAAAGSPGASPAPGSGGGVRLSHRAVLEAAGFRVRSYSFPTPHAWTADELVGYLHSTSYASRRALGDRLAGHDAAVRAALAACDPGGRYAGVVEFSYLLSRPAAGR